MFLDIYKIIKYHKDILRIADNCIHELVHNFIASLRFFFFVTGLVQESPSQMQTTITTASTTATAAATATADPSVEGFAQIKSESQQQQHRKQNIELVDDA